MPAAKPRPSNRKLQAFHLHGHVGKDAISDYADVFRAIAQIPPDERILEKGDHLVCLSTCDEPQPGRFHLITHEGEPGLRPLILNLSNLSERSNRLGLQELLTTRTHCVVEPASRRAVIEYNQRGVKADDLSALISGVGRRHFGPDFVFEFTPVIRGSFVQDLEKLHRIRLASVTMVKPNMAWNDDAVNLIEGLEDSGAQRLSLEITARPHDSLSKRAGLIQRLVRLMRRGVTSIKQAKVIGQGDGDREVTVKLVNHVESRNVALKRDAAGHPDSGQVSSELDRFLDDLKKRGA